MKIIVSFALCCLGFVLLFATFGLFPKTPNQYTQPFLASPSGAPTALHLPQEQETQTLTLLFVGDIMLDRGVEWKIKQNPPTGGGGNWRWPFLKIADTLREIDLVFGNLESQISDKGRNVGSIYSFRADPQSMEGLTYAGFHVVSVANNHSFDYTREAFEDSSKRLREAGILPVADTLMIKDVKGVKIGFLAYSNFAGAAKVDWTNLEETIRDIQNVKSQVDILVVSLHAGEEYAEAPNEFQKTFAQNAIDAGANLFVGHHPHVVQPLEQYEQGWIAYSLGNFVFDQAFSKETMQGAVLKVVLENKAIKEVSLLPTKLTPSFQVQLVE